MNKKCSSCSYEQTDPLISSQQNCPLCGAVFLEHANVIQTESIAITKASAGPGTLYFLLNQFLDRLKKLIFNPSKFFSTQREQLFEESIATALTFAVVVEWLAGFFNFIWRSTIWIALENRLVDFYNISLDVFSSDSSPSNLGLGSKGLMGISNFIFGAGSVVLTPFMTVLRLLFISSFLLFASKILIQSKNEKKVSYEMTLKIMAYSCAPWALCVIPGVGVLLASFLSLITTVIGFREVYQISTARSMGVVFFPAICLLLLIGFFAFIFSFFAFHLFRMVL